MKTRKPLEPLLRWPLLAYGLLLLVALTARAAEPPKPAATPDLDKLAGQPVDLSPWAYAWRADREVQEKPEAWFIPRRLERIDKSFRPMIEDKFPSGIEMLKGDRATMPAAPQGRLLSALLWNGPLPTQRIEVRWPDGSAVPPIEAIEVRVYPSVRGWFGFVADKALTAPAVSADGRTLTYLNEMQDPQGKKTPLFGPTDMVAVFFDPSKAPAGAKYGCPDIHLYVQSMKWSEINLEIEWGFKEGAEQAVFDGRIEAYCGYVKSVKSLSEDKGTTMTGADAWQSAPTGGGARRGIAVSLVYLGRSGGMGRGVSPFLSRITLWTKAGNLTFLPHDATFGPILVPGSGVMVAKAGTKTTARQFAAELAAKSLKTIPQLAREHPEAASWEELMRKVKAPGTVIPPLVPFEDPPETAMRVALPDERWTDAWRRSSWLLKGGWHFWGKLALEAARPIRTTDLVGHSATSARRLEYWLQAPGNKPDGDFVDGAGGFEYAPEIHYDIGWSHDSRHPQTGRMLYSMAEHYLLTGDKQWFQKNRARLEAAADWILRQHSEYLKGVPDREKLAVAGLQPPQVLGDFVNGSYWRWFIINDAFSVQGLRRFADALAEFDPEAAQRYRAKTDAYAKDVLRAVEQEIALAPVRQVRDGTYRRIIPPSPYLRGSRVSTELRSNHGLIDHDMGALPLADAHAVLDAADPRVGEYLEVIEEWHVRQRTNDPFWSGSPEVSKYSFPDTIHLRRDDVPSFLRYWMVVYARWVHANGLMAEGGTGDSLPGNPAEKPKGGDLGSTGWFMEGFRNLLVMEDGQSLWLARATPRVWLEQGKKISVKNAPTEFGTAAYEITSDVDNGKITATVEMPSRKAPKEVILRFRHPKVAPIKSVTVNGKPWTEFNKDKETITLKGLTGNVTVTAQY